MKKSFLRNTILVLSQVIHLEKIFQLFAVYRIYYRLFKFSQPLKLPKRPQKQQLKLKMVKSD